MNLLYIVQYYLVNQDGIPGFRKLVEMKLLHTNYLSIRPLTEELDYRQVNRKIK
jgi:hypothetical protein